MKAVLEFNACTDQSNEPVLADGAYGLRTLAQVARRPAPYARHYRETRAAAPYPLTRLS
jgi:hypothetical protein